MKKRLNILEIFMFCDGHLADYQAPAWEPMSCKLLLGRFSGSGSFKDRIPKLELGNERKRIVHEKHERHEQDMLLFVLFVDSIFLPSDQILDGMFFLRNHLSQSSYPQIRQ